MILASLQSIYLFTEKELNYTTHIFNLRNLSDCSVHSCIITSIINYILYKESYYSRSYTITSTFIIEISVI